MPGSACCCWGYSLLALALALLERVLARVVLRLVALGEESLLGRVALGLRLWLCGWVGLRLMVLWPVW